KRSTAALTMASQFASELGRLATISTLPPRAVHASATFFSSAALPAESTTLAPAPASTLAASAPNAPDAPVTIAVLLRTSNSDSGFFRKSSELAWDMMWLTVKAADDGRACPGHLAWTGAVALLSGMPGTKAGHDASKNHFGAGAGAMATRIEHTPLPRL